ncbi:hypothetical protein, variant 2 [Blastomyces dermatitidis ER-3]|uniref:Tyrosinase copper-binding domain-containing protein n=1 Tax=Ajellomyces dermatitidis (strain ER-3 / ATCC MYA-2586) TaxID=559297 RepID=A0ABX2VV73_AJEDR|nr:uncharacterized protein BDCG_04182 [Blastomyces dermatitidis ER-3]XP_045280784.1 hypothetical protein, variant 1 [Blastomyces dermatitidis ER-3]XP_045280785.1 hypothetical protein, variant 2 [Blastomyces dermatitidis ER-3]OAT01056.1 hypothetical protein BDCG_04182 [Blastomyces dermatitidis ER-3]OAT01057.1 hypothetical protein, variant 1 [Blastomyces dermatitidis ER-3]OAT01058.1 hypothetical protein, variant 2 [Blastomyces dermatitidis ER-3]
MWSPRPIVMLVHVKMLGCIAFASSTRGGGRFPDCPTTDHDMYINIIVSSGLLFKFLQIISSFSFFLVSLFGFCNFHDRKALRLKINRTRPSMVWLRRVILFLSVVCSVVSARCTTPGQRKAWHTLSNSEKQAYIDAELCLMRKPPKTAFKGVITRFDDFQALHVHTAYMNHYVGAFLPFHRLMTYSHEAALREECGYKGYQPYWYEQMDAGKFSSSDIFDSVYGFGGNGFGREGCITDGPFANYTSPFGPGSEIRTQCIDRNFDDAVSLGTSRARVEDCTSKPNWISAWNCIELNPHGGGHNGVGGQMARGGASPGDPIFFLHHAWIDKLWWDWQAKDLPARLSEMGGTNFDENSGFPPGPPDYPQPGAMPGDPGNITTLNHVLFMFGTMGDDKIIADVMDIQGDFLCYGYVDPE